MQNSKKLKTAGIIIIVFVFLGKCSMTWNANRERIEKERKEAAHKAKRESAIKDSLTALYSGVEVIDLKSVKVLKNYVSLAYTVAQVTGENVFLLIEGSKVVSVSPDKSAIVREYRKKTHWITSQFNAWDGSHYNLELRVKHGMRDPSSYEHIETRYNEEKDGLLIETTYRGRNGFGGMTIETTRARTNKKGEIIEIL